MRVFTLPIIILTHGRLGEEIIKSAEMILGPLEGVYAVSLMPGVGPEEFLAQVDGVLQQVLESSLIITDLFGGTPSNVAAVISKKRRVCAVSGLSIAMLIEAVTSRENMTVEELAESVISAGKDGCKNIGKLLEELIS